MRLPWRGVRCYCIFVRSSIAQPTDLRWQFVCEGEKEGRKKGKKGREKYSRAMPRSKPCKPLPQQRTIE